MTLIATKDRSQSDVIAYEAPASMPGFSRKNLTVMGSATLAIGSIVLDQEDGTWVELNSSSIAALAVDVAIVIDPRAEAGDFSTAADASVLCMTQMGGVKREFLTYLGTMNDSNTNLLEAYFEANNKIRFETSQDPIA